MKNRISKDGAFCGCGCGAYIPERKPSGGIRYSRSQDGKFYISGHNPLPTGINHHKWKGGKYITSSGYTRIYYPGHPRADHDGHVLEHILIWERIHGILQPNQQIHHINGNRSDNRLENLIALTISAHHRLHVVQQGGRIWKNKEHCSSAGKKGAKARWG